MKFGMQNSQSKPGTWLPDMDLNHDKQIQSLLCYRYTIGQAGAFAKLKGFLAQSSRHAKQGVIESPFSYKDFAPDGALN